MQTLVSIYRGDREGSRHSITTALMLNPFPPAWYRWVEGVSYFINTGMNDALYVLLEALQQNPELNVARASLVAVYGELGKGDAARRQAMELLRRNPGLTARALLRRLPISTESLRRRLVGAFIRAGIPRRSTTT